ncbi:MAG: hypothetical protein ACPG08_04370 [Flavobacteriales bacterium]
MHNLHTNRKNYALWPLMGLLLAAFLFEGCTKREFNLSEDTPLTGTLDPVFAVPLVHGSWSFGEVMDAIEIPATLETDASGEITAVFPFDAFEASPISFMPLSESAEVVFLLNEEQALALSLLPAGEEFAVDFSNTLNVPMAELAEVDSVRLGEGALTISMESAFPLNLTAMGVCENLVIEGQPLTVELELVAGSQPTSLSIPMTGATLMGTGADGVTLGWSWSFVLASSGQSIEPGEGLSILTAFEEAAVTGAFGKFSSELSHPIEASMAMPELTSWDPALFYLSAPRLVMEVQNSFGVNLGLNITELALLSGNDATLLQGTAIDNFPDLAGAAAVGDTALTTHVLDNAGMDPDLSDVMNAAPDSLQLIGTVDVLPPSGNGQFAMSTDVLRCTGALEVPLAGWAQGVMWRDTLDSPISQELQAGVAPPLDWMDVASLTLRFIVDNGWPLELNGSINFINSEGDSLLAGPGLSIPGASDAPTAVTVDYTLDRSLALELMEIECAGMAVAWTLATTDADAGQSVQVYAQDAMSMRIAAKVECQIDPTP